MKVIWQDCLSIHLELLNLSPKPRLVFLGFIENPRIFIPFILELIGIL